jgi:hypothetical protein
MGPLGSTGSSEDERLADAIKKQLVAIYRGLELDRKLVPEEITRGVLGVLYVSRLPLKVKEP